MIERIVHSRGAKEHAEDRFMKRWIWAIAALCWAAGVEARADYVKFIYNPSAAKGSGALKGGQQQEQGSGGGGGDEGEGGRPRGGIGVRSGGGGGAPNQPGQGRTEPKKEDLAEFSAFRVEVVVEVVRGQLSGGIRTIKTKYGKEKLPLVNTDDVTHEYIPMKGTVAERYKKMKESSDKSVEGWRSLAKNALENRLLDEFASAMEELKKLDAKDPTAVAFSQVQEGLRHPPALDPSTAAMKGERFGDASRETDHYSILYKSNKLVPKDLDVWADQLEQNFKAVYYWFAFHNKPMPMPARKLVIVLVTKRQDFHNEILPAFDNPPTVADGFFMPRDHILVCCNEPLDEAYAGLSRILENMSNAGWITDKALDKFYTNVPAILFANKVEVVKGAYKILVHKVMREESRLRTITHLGSAQLIAEARLLPEGVEAPRWIQFGVPSFFETGEGSLWPNTGLPNQKYLTKFQAWKSTEKAERVLDKAPEALRSVVTDAYFNSSHEEPEALLKARTMTWSLTYYLAMTNLEGLKRYYQEMAKLPRDMAFDEPALMACFARAFGLTESGSSNEVNRSKLEQMAFNWYSMMGDLTSPFATSQDKGAQMKTRNGGR